MCAASASAITARMLPWRRMTPPARIGRYTIGERIGEGGAAEVYRAHLEGAEGFTKPLVVKRVRAALSAEPAIARMFIDEARLAQRLVHGGIVQIHDLGVDDGAPYLVMELVDGLSLAELLDDLHDRGERLALAEALHVVETVCDALAYAHRLTDEGGRPLGIVHRDVNPRNILVSREGLVKLADFGIAKRRGPAATLPGIIKGSIGYLSPEQAAGLPVDARSDQFAVGVVLHELVAGDNPYLDADTLERIRVTLEQPLPPLPRDGAVDDELQAIVARATAYDAAERFPSLAELGAALEAWRVSRKVGAGAAPLGARVRRVKGEAPRAIDAAVVAHLPTERRTVAPAARRQRVWPWIVVPVLAAGGVGLALMATRVPLEIALPSIPPEPPPPPPPQAIPDPIPARAPAPAPTVPPSPTAAAMGQLKINLLPFARVELDGRSIGETPVSTSVRAGRHRLTLSNPETGRRVTRAIVVPKDGVLEITSW
jgi:tRNA A-37 threonylcarbamoyl transferase component Bud32